jgi:hypothetical protein
MALLISAHPLLAAADSSAITLNSGDFVSAQKITRDGETLVNVKLSKSGKAKFKKLNKQAVDKEIDAEIADVSTHFKLKEPIKGDELEMGPYSTNQADKVVTEVNKK